MSFAHTEVRPHNGVPTIFADGAPLHGMTATSVAFGEPEVVRGFVEGGAEILMIWIEAPLKCWRGPGQYDWSYAEEKLRFFEEHGGDTKWIIRIRLGIVAGWFAEEFPGEVHGTHSEGRAAGAVIHSSLWLREVSQVLFDFVSWLKTTKWAPRILGFMLNAGATEEWLPFDVGKMFQGQYHPVVEREFKGWLLRNYGQDSALQAAWNDPNANFKTAQPPRGQMRRGSHIWGPFTLRDPQIDRPAIDYYRFLNETLADALISLCQRAKDAAQTPIICGGFHSYLWWETGVYSYIQEYGHGLIQRLNQSSSVDFVSDITSYDGRYPGGPSGYLGLAASLNLNQKLHYTEVDITTHVNMPVGEREKWEKSAKNALPGSAEPILSDRYWKWSGGHCGRDEAESVAVMQRESAHNLITGTPYWWFDIKKRSFATPGLTRAMKELSDIGKQAVNWNRASLSQVAFVCSEETPMFQSAMNGDLLRFEMEAAHPLLLDGCTKKWGLAGVPFDTYELHDLAHPDFPGDQYKLLIFVNCAKVSAAAARGIERWKKDGKTHLWTFAAACLSDERFDVSLGENLIGMRLNCEMKRRVIRVEIDDRAGELARGDVGFGTDIAVGPVFYADDPNAEVLGRLQEGGEAGFALQRHADWNALYLSMLNFGPQMLRNLARFSEAHVWCESDDVIYANSSLLCLHTASAGEKTVRLPQFCRVTDLLHPENPVQETDCLQLKMDAYRTAIWRLEEI